MKLSEVKAGKKFSIGTREFIKVSGDDKQSVCIAKDCVFDSTYGSNNNFSESKILQRLNEEILPEIEAAVGQENILEFETDLTSLDGLKTYGAMTSKISIPTFDMYRNNVSVFDEHKIDDWWWLATPDSTPEHANGNWCVCVSPSGYFDDDNCFYFDGGVRPVLLFVSSIFVSCEE